MRKSSAGPSSHRYDLFRKRLDAFASEVHGLEDGDIDAVHGTRVASRRIREVLPLLELAHETTRQLNRRLRKVTRKLGRTRELDVMALLMDKLQRYPQHSPRALKALNVAASRAREDARERLAAKLPIAKLKRLTRKLERVATHVELVDTAVQPRRASRPARTWRWALEARLIRRAAGLRAAIEAAGALYDSRRLHQIRIAIKKLRYAAELANETGIRNWTEDVARLKAAQDLLGRLHDLEVLLTWWRDAQSPLTPSGFARGKDLGALIRGVEGNCRRLHARYMGDRAALLAIANRMGAGRSAATLTRRLSAV